MQKLTFWFSLLLVFTIPFEAVIEDPALGSASRLVGFAMAASWLAAIVVAGRMRKLNSYHVALSAFVILNAVSIFWTASAERTMSHIVTWLQLLLMALIFWDLYTTHTRILAALQMYILGAYVAVGDTIVNFVQGQSFYTERFSAANTHPDDLGIILALGLPVAVYLAVFRPADRLSLPLKVVNSLYVFVALVGIALSGTRSALIAAIPGMIFILAVAARLSRPIKIGIGIVFLAAALCVAPMIPEASVERLGTTGTEIEEGDFNGRVRLWSEGLVSFQRHPMLGIGSNMYRTVTSESKVAHNSFVSVLVELGIAGFLLFTIVLFKVGARIFGQPVWDTRLWLCIFMTWIIGASTLTWEYRKPTWLFLNLIVASAATLRVRELCADVLPDNGRLAHLETSQWIAAPNHSSAHL